MAITDIEPRDADVVDGHATEISHPPAVIPPVPPTLAVVPTVQATELVQRLDVIKQAMNTAMAAGQDYGKVPGTDKPTLLKPGAEKLAVLFQFDVQTVCEKVWGPGEHLTVIARATVFHAPTGVRLGGGEGLCSTREKKYAKRRSELVCPECQKPNVRRSKRDPEFYCWQKTGGCGAKFPLDDQRITGQQVGDVDNPDLADTWNTVIKMAKKRALVDAVLLTTGASALFTQDVEDDPRGRDQEPEPDRPAPPALVTDEDIKSLQAAAKGLSAAQIKLAMGAVGVAIPEPFVWNRVPKDHAAALAEKLAATERTANAAPAESAS